MIKKSIATKSGMDRRSFLRQASLGTAIMGAAGAALAQEPPGMASGPLPKVRLGDHEITRLIAGYNPIGGYSHLSAHMSSIMRDWFTVERTAAFLQRCEALGINTFQFDITEKTMQALDIVWGSGSKLKFLCLHGGRPNEEPLARVKDYRAFAVAHHGGATDARFRAGRVESVHDFVKEVHDMGFLAGVSSHNPENIARIEDAGWENDFYMTCFHNVTRTHDEMIREFGAATVGEPFFDSDPEKMCAVVRQVKKPCLAFKILAAGRKCDTRNITEQAFKYAFENIKKSDAVIVGMFPRDSDQVLEDVEHTLKYGVA